MNPEFKLSKTIFSALRISLLILVISILTVFVVQNAAAGSSNTIPKYGFLGGVTAYANVKSLQIPGSSNGDCGIRSYTSPATNINIIGWTWWQCDRYNGQIFVNSILRDEGISDVPASSYSDNFTWVGAFTGGVNRLKAHGVHDFNHNGASPWTPYNVNFYP